MTGPFAQSFAIVQLSELDYNRNPYESRIVAGLNFRFRPCKYFCGLTFVLWSEYVIAVACGNFSDV